MMRGANLAQSPGLGEVRDFYFSPLLPSKPGSQPPIPLSRRGTLDPGVCTGRPRECAAYPSPPSQSFFTAPAFRERGPDHRAEFACTPTFFFFFFKSWYPFVSDSTTVSFLPSVNLCLRFLWKPCICLDVCLWI